MHLRGRLQDGGRISGGSISTSPLLFSRAEKNTDNGSSNVTFIIIGVILGVVAIATLVILVSRFRRTRSPSGQKTTHHGQGSGPLGFISSIFRSKGRRYQATSGHEGAELNASSGMQQDVEQAPNLRTNANGATAGAAVDRNSSIRSVLTLPAYSRAASNTEQVIGREGDRDGMDVVVDLPTEEEVEALRENEMDALYQLRSARRQQHEERIELRRQRREARDRNDFVTLASLQSRSRAASNSNNSTVEDLRRGINRAKDNRQRSVSSVSYADLGVARHDGTRIRASSQESERMGLLSDAAEMGHVSRPRAGSSTSHHAGLSTHSIMSMGSDATSSALTLHQDGTRDSQEGQPSSRRTSSGDPLAGSSPELVESDLGVEAMPPPEYEDVPLGEEDGHRSTTPLDDPPPDYSGPHHPGSSGSQRMDNDEWEGVGGTIPTDSQADGRRGRGVGGIPQLPSLRLSRLPAIVIEPSSAQPRDDDDVQSREWS